MSRDNLRLSRRDLLLYWRLPFDARMVLPVWGGIGLLLYFCYGYRHSHVGRGRIEVPDDPAPRQRSSGDSTSIGIRA